MLQSPSFRLSRDTRTGHDCGARLSRDSHLLSGPAGEGSWVQQAVQSAMNRGKVLRLPQPADQIIVQSLLLHPVTGRLRQHAQLLVTLLEGRG